MTYDEMVEAAKKILTGYDKTTATEMQLIAQQRQSYQQYTEERDKWQEMNQSMMGNYTQMYQPPWKFSGYTNQTSALTSGVESLRALVVDAVAGRAQVGPVIKFEHSMEYHVTLSGPPINDERDTISTLLVINDCLYYLEEEPGVRAAVEEALKTLEHYYQDY